MTSILLDAITLSLTEQQKVIFKTGGDRLPVFCNWKFETTIPVDVPVLKKMIICLFQQHEALSTRFVEQANLVYPLQRIMPDDVSGYHIAVESHPGNATDFLLHCRNYPHETEMRCVFMAAPDTTAGYWNAYLQFPSGIVDFHSMGKLCVAIQELFSGRIAAIPVVAYSQYVSWQHDTLKEVPEAVKDWCNKQLSGQTDFTPFLFHRTAPVIAGKYETTCRHTIPLSSVITREYCYAIFAILLSHFTNKNVVRPGIVLPGRIYDELDQTVGLIDQVVPLQLTFDETCSFHQLRTLTGNLLSELQSVAEYISHDLIHTTPYIIQYVKMPEGVSLDDWQVLQPGAALQLDILEDHTHITTRWNYNTACFKKSDVEQLDVVLQRLFEKGTALPDNLTDVNQLTETFSVTPVKPDPTQKDILGMFNTACHKYAAKTAVMDDLQSYTYTSLQEQSDMLAKCLIAEKGIQRGDIIALCTSRSADLIAVILAILKTGAAFLPVDMSQPDERIHAVLNDASPALILTALPGDRHIPGNTCTVNSLFNTTEINTAITLPQTQGTDLAYIIYTSGTTGKPKGCMISRENLSHYIHWCNNNYLKNNDYGNFPWFTPLSFDLTITTIFLPLVKGKRIVVFPETKQADVILQECFSGVNGVDSIKLTPSHISLLKHTDIKSTSIQLVITGGEQLLHSQVDLLFGLNEKINLYNEYGPTEATVGCIVKKIQPDDELITIGNPIAGMRAMILNNRQEPLMRGLMGELYLYGNGIAKGYLNNTTLTGEKFITLGNTLFYRTGDLVRRLPNGELIFLGRIDSQVKIRGYRIETEEILYHLTRIKGIVKAHILVEQQLNEPVLAAFYEATSVIDKQQLLKALSEKLPAYMIPQQFYQVKNMPLSVNGKTDEKQLRLHTLTIKEDAVTFEPPINETEEKIAAIWMEILQVNRIGRNDHFFTSGGQSIKASALVARLNKQFHTTLTLKDIFEYPVISEQATQITNHIKSSPAEGPIVLPAQEMYELSGQQLRIWTEHHATPLSTAYNMPVAYRISGPFDIARLVAAFEKVITQFESLRTTFVDTGAGGIKQQIHPGNTLQYHYEELARDADIGKILQDHGQQYIALDVLPLYRVAVYKVAAEDWLLLINLHHIIADGLSEDILLNRLFTYYEADHAVNVLKAPLQYKEYAAWQNKLNAAHRHSAAYWLHKFNTPVPASGIPAPGKTTRLQEDMADTYTVDFGKELTAGLLAFSNTHQHTLFTALLSIVDLLLYRYSGVKERVIAVPVDNRLDVVFEQQVGFFLNTILLKNTLDSAADALQLIDNWATELAEALQHKQYPYEWLARELVSRDQMQGQSLFHALVNFQEREHGNVIEKGGLRLEKMDYNYRTNAKVELAFNFSLHNNNLYLAVDYNSSLYSGEFIHRMTRHCMELTRQLMLDAQLHVGKIPMLDDAEQQQLFAYASGPCKALLPGMTIISSFQEQSLKHAGRIAVVSPSGSTTYEMLGKKVGIISELLTDWGVEPEQVVPVLAAGNELTIVTMLAIMQCGAVYLPIDAKHPEPRINSILKQAGVNLVLNTSGMPFLLAGIDIRVPETNRPLYNYDAPVVINQESPAYMIFTSGTTGVPKGLTITHGGFMNMIAAQTEGFGIRETDRCGWFASPGFDASLSEIFMALFSGAALHIPEPGLMHNQPLFIDWLTEHAITVATITPAYLQALPSALPSALRVLISAGETLPVKTGQALAARHTLFNAYGPSENAVCTTFTKINPSDTVMSIGTPIVNVKVRVVDTDGMMVPVGVPGELHISGPGLAKGYYNNDRETGKHFYEEDHQHWYRTGDWVQWLPGGLLEFIGRRDQQIKINGNRMETEEVTRCLLELPAVKDAVVVYHTFETAQHPVLLAYVVLQEEYADYTTDALMFACRTVLPSYMVPAFFVPVEHIPLNINGKKDITGLPSPFLHIPDHETVAVTAAEILLCELYGELLGITVADRFTNFFAAGGQSLMAIKLISAIYRQEKKRITLGDLYRYPVVHELASLLEAKEKDPDLQEERQDRWISATPMQQHVWADMELQGGLKYLMTGAFELKGPLDVSLWLKATTKVLEEQDALRYRFRLSGNGLLCKPFAIEVTQVQFQDHMDGQDKETFVKELSAIAIDPTLEPLCYCYLREYGAGDYLFAFKLHHLIGDAWTIKILFTSILAYYHASTENENIISYNNYADEISKVSPFVPDRKRLAGTGILKEITGKSGEGYFKHLFSESVLVSIRALAQLYEVSSFAVITGLQALSFMEAGESAALTVYTPLHGRFDPRWHHTAGVFMNVVAFTIARQPGMRLATLLQEVQRQYTRFTNDTVAFTAQWIPSAAEENIARGTMEIHIDDFSEQYGEQIKSLPDIAVLPFESSINMVRKFSVELHFKTDYAALMAECLFDRQFFSESNIRRGINRLEQLLLAPVHDDSLTVAELMKDISNRENATVQASQSSNIKAFLTKR
ncbi:amino acid adenylation domain-containing protein [Chitinophaga sancti]|uniref:non-ribosomal peptide synthetase n=1 Tax=Chitinophaga sancti TaxID=1004 RepID=UPI002A7505D2|nr:non-ribosomal peptide synthetase [Chitinophaga sancti]WPQ66226.1 amino acid adenylation domain-containing protein [Chitinophaga sancti]